MRNSILYALATFLIFSCQSVFAQKWVETVELQQNKISNLQIQIQKNTQIILEQDALRPNAANLNNVDILQIIYDHLSVTNSILTNIQVEQMLFEMITGRPQISNAQKLMRLRQTQLQKELSLRGEQLQRNSQQSKNNETTRLIFEARDLIKTTQEIVSNNFKY